MWKLNQSLFGGEEEGRDDFLAEDSDGICSLSPMQSLIVFAKPIKFAVVFTCGNLLSVGSTAFLIGAAQQMRMMFDSTRVFATSIYLGCVILALICALWIHNKVLTIIAIICEICALIWYSLSYIPFARRMVSDLMVRLCDTEL
ncbi:vesicle transport protein SFT2B isoform X2 [Rhodamnia argentea]|uniref:Vesicle transport protein n=1 Tax=Rhodamnia argentea TaxID=178133 RepID=A0ABM3GTR2_9MYRT|nr:vesicle transport protein SFT2B isoform X2 [Rhodamnia argentea]